MNQAEAKQQVEAFFQRLGEKISFSEEKNFAKARVGEAILGFEFDETDGVLSCQALIYRFRNAPRDEILDAAFAEEDSATDGFRVVFDSENRSLYLQRDYAEKIDDNVFYEQVNRLASASIVWNSEVLCRIAEKNASR